MSAVLDRDLLRAARAARLEDVRALLARGANPSAKGAGTSPLHETVAPDPHGPTLDEPVRGQIVALLVASGADVARRAGWLRLTPIQAAAMAGSRRLVDALVAAGCPVDAFAAVALGEGDATGRDENGLHALHYAAGSRMYAQSPAIAARLCAEANAAIAAGTSADDEAIPGAQAVRPVTLAINAGHRDMVDLLLKRGANADAAMAASAWNGSDPILDDVLAAGGSPDARDAAGSPVLVELVRWGQAGRADRLLSRGADPNARAANGRTALHAAASRGSRPLVERLLAAGADIALADGAGLTPGDIARAKGRDAVLDLLV